MAKFSNARKGDRVWSIIYGYGEIIAVYNANNECPLDVMFDGGKTRSYTFDGKYNTDCNHPELFWNEFNIPTDDEDKKSFDLVEFLKVNLEPREFEYESNNEYLGYDDGEWKRCVSSRVEVPTVYFKSICDSVTDELTTEGITVKQLIQAYKDLGWIRQ